MKASFSQSEDVFSRGHTTSVFVVFVVFHSVCLLIYLYEALRPIQQFFSHFGMAPRFNQYMY